MFAVVLTLCCAGPLPGTQTPFELDTRAANLVTTWDLMVADGVRAAELVELRYELAAARRTESLGVALAFWRPSNAALLDRLQAATSAIWLRNLSEAQETAVLAELHLRKALVVEPAIDRKQRAADLAAASTPAQLLALRDQWDLESRLVPVDRSVAAETAKLAVLVQRGNSAGMITDPGPAALARAAAYAQLDDTERLAAAASLLSDVRAIELDLQGRLNAAAAAKASLDAVANLIQLAGSYGVNTAPFRSQLAAERVAYAGALTVAQFAAITPRVAGITGALNAAIQRAITAARAPVRPIAAPVQNQVFIIQGVAFYYQTHALSCEETSMSMALTHQGIHLSQNQILAELGADRRPQYIDKNGVLRWGNPYISFVGNVNGVENVTGLQANYPALVRVAQAHGASIIAAGPMSASSIYSQIAAGHPVVVYATWDWRWHPRHDYLSFDGRWIPYIGPASSHVYTAVGVRPDAVLVNDPIRGQYWISKGSFQAGYSDFSEAIVFA